jgi:hypothetical protein
MDDIEINLDSGRKGGTGGIGPNSSSNVPQSIPDQISKDVAPSTQGGNLFSRFDIRRSGHPVACACHMLFKAFAIIAYGSSLTSDTCCLALS